MLDISRNCDDVDGGGVASRLSNCGCEDVSDTAEDVDDEVDEDDEDDEEKEEEGMVSSATPADTTSLLLATLPSTE